MTDPTETNKESFSLVSTVTKSWCAKLLLITVALVLFQIPLFIIRELSNDRQDRLKTVQNEMAESWGKAQLVKMHHPADEEEYSVVISPQIRYRGIYEVAVYNADVNIKTIHKNRSRAIENRICVSDTKNVKHCSVKINGNEVKVEDMKTYFKFELPAGDSQSEIKLILKGSQEFRCSPNAKSKSNININGTWSNPGFIGNVLPDTRTVKDKNFSAQWHGKTLQNKTQFCPLADDEFRPSVGVEFCTPAGSYQKVERCINYATFFLIIFFFTIIAAEIITKVYVHILQYIVAAGAAVLFYLMTLAFSEKFGFSAGFIASAAVVVSMIIMYARLFIGRMIPAVVIGGVFAVSYLFNFLILQMEDWALFSGTIVLALILGTTMVLTGKINRKNNCN